MGLGALPRTESGSEVCTSPTAWEKNCVGEELKVRDRVGVAGLILQGVCGANCWAKHRSGDRGGQGRSAVWAEQRQRGSGIRGHALLRSG